MPPDAKITVTVQMECGGASVVFVKECEGPYDSELAADVAGIMDEAMDTIFSRSKVRPPHSQEEGVKTNK